MQNFPEKPVVRHFMSKEHKPTDSMNKNITNEGQANSSTPKTKGLLPILICAAISAAALLCARFAATPLSFLNGASKASKTEREAQILKKAQARTAITNVTNDAERSLQEAQQRMEAKIDTAGSARFQRFACTKATPTRSICLGMHASTERASRKTAWPPWRGTARPRSKAIRARSKS